MCKIEYVLNGTEQIFETFSYMMKRIEDLKGQTGVTFSGGDPMFQPKACAILAKKIHELGMNVWVLLLLCTSYIEDTVCRRAYKTVEERKLNSVSAGKSGENNIAFKLVSLTKR